MKLYQGKHHKRSRGRTGKSAALLVSLLLLLTVIVGGTIAFLMDSDGPLNNLFNPSKVTTYVDETVSGNTKSDVSIKNTGDTTAWIRAAIVVTWQDKDGNVYGQLPVEGTDYTMELNVVDKNGWLKGDDGFYYWYLPVKSVEEDANNCSTGVLIESCTTEKSVTVGSGDDAVTYYLTVEIIGSGIQSKPDSVYTSEWEPSSGIQILGDHLDPNAE